MPLTSATFRYEDDVLLLSRFCKESNMRVIEEAYGRAHEFEEEKYAEDERTEWFRYEIDTRNSNNSMVKPKKSKNIYPYDRSDHAYIKLALTAAIYSGDTRGPFRQCPKKF